AAGAPKAVQAQPPKPAGEGSVVRRGSPDPAGRRTEGLPRVTMGVGGGNGTNGNGRARVTVSGQGQGGRGIMEKSLDWKLSTIDADPNCREFIIADAKDADMALGLGAPGQSPEMHAGEVRFKTLEDYREQMRLIARSALVDIMLMSVSSNHALTIR